MDLLTVMIISTFSSLLLCGVFLYLYKKYGERFTAIWAASWAFYAARNALDMLRELGMTSTGLLFLDTVCPVLVACLLLWGTYDFIGKAIPQWWLFLPVAGVAAAAATVTLSASHSVSALFFLFMSSIYLWTGICFLRSEKIHGVGKALTGWSIILWGIHTADYPFLQDLPALATWGYLIGSLLKQVISISILLVYFENTRDHLAQAQKELRAQKEELQQILDHAPMAIYYMDREAKIVRVNKAVERMTGFSEAEVLGKQSLDFLILNGQTRYEEALSVIQTGQPILNKTYPIKKKHSTEIRWASIDKLPYRDEAGNIIGVLSFSVDITDRHKAEEEIRFLALHDPLTKLPNRYLIDDRLGQALATAKRNSAMLALLYIDLDDFKPVNDQYGHRTGDQVLQIVACRLQKTLRDSDTVGRLGGDEFVVILPNIITCKDAVHVSEKIIAQVAEPIVIDDDVTIQIGASVGVSLFPLNGTDADSLMISADNAMYAAKQVGGNQVACFAAGA
ncbi:diguanylate cyclase [Heliobacterium gestii]|uniref:Diguanylate cyclase n=1 Tax=Heliomicrobium gestii TaxID=2699 RepID=A0A845LB14_HELGE|nr:sensor domain-containing diguanylate cyclase [Heliomicrobium gestii]MBM7867484.1 diguanylate cyclase (GGDEF)-like protein/PAS domain S-box-containing protein [Heliomicrobium gestii]MZP43967.1 diguanylate cyclase [Heliomicrobium gestii]